MLLQWGQAGGIAEDIVLDGATYSFSGANVTANANSAQSLVGYVYGLEYGIGSYSYSENVAGEAESQSITVDFGADGLLAGPFQGRVYYNTDPLDDSGTRVYGTPTLSRFLDDGFLIGQL